MEKILLSNMAERYEKPAENASAGEFVAWIVPRRIRDICRWKIFIASHRGEFAANGRGDSKSPSFPKGTLGGDVKELVF